MNFKIPFLIALLVKVRPAWLASFLKRILRINRFIYSTPQGKFFIDPASQFGFTLLSSGTYEKEVTEYIQNTLNPGDVFIDIGSNEGFFSIVASNLVNKTGKVISVEPHSRLQPILFKNSELNECYNIYFFNLVYLTIMDLLDFLFLRI